ncbi:MAG: tyrosine-type recombinase/integrase [Proteobacteria bacterium]|nr:tyrosine-type recombinase/integrase [Pseudomonadota bacterium]
MSGKDHPLSSKTIRNIWVALSSFFTWASVEFDFPNPMKGIPAPRFEVAPIEPFSKEDIEALLKACKFCRESNPKNRRRFTMRRPTARRDRAIILTLLDTGLRASELCSLTIGDVDQRMGKMSVKHGLMGGAKKSKGRTVFLGKSARRALWRYLVEREDGEDFDAPLFLGHFDRR